jgi:hypothetical protein
LSKIGETYSKVLSVLKASEVSALARASAGTIKVPKGHNGRLKEVRITSFGTLETVVCAGGLVEIENDAIKIQFSAVIGGKTAVTEGGGDENRPEIFKVDMPQKQNSTYTVYFTPYDDQGQGLQVELTWVVGASTDPTRANYVMADMVLKASAITQITVAEEHNTISVPEGKGGRLLEVQVICFPTLETVVLAGGKVVLDSEADNWKPFEMIIGGAGAVGASGGADIHAHKRAVNKELSGNSDVTSDFTPYDNQSQSLGLTLLWRGKDPT